MAKIHILMGYNYDKDQMAGLLQQIFTENLNPDSVTWINEQLKKFENSRQAALFNLTFTAIPRFVDKIEITLSPGEQKTLEELRHGLNLSGWTSDRLVRSWWLLQLPHEDEENYFKKIKSLLKAAEVNEQVAVYGSLPLLAYPERFVQQTATGLRTNIKNVFDAIVLNNPYPSGYLGEEAWNQLVLKAFFMDRPVNRIIGLDKRTNQKLAYILSDYAHERWAAERPVNPLLWRPVGPFIDEKLFPDIQKLFLSDDVKEKQAAALACYHSKYEPAKVLLGDFEEMKEKIEKKELTWSALD